MLAAIRALLLVGQMIKQEWIAVQHDIRVNLSERDYHLHERMDHLLSSGGKDLHIQKFSSIFVKWIKKR